jgi:hypothetical protein
MPPELLREMYSRCTRERYSDEREDAEYAPYAGLTVRVETIILARGRTLKRDAEIPQPINYVLMPTDRALTRFLFIAFPAIETPRFFVIVSTPYEPIGDGRRNNSGPVRARRTRAIGSSLSGVRNPSGWQPPKIPGAAASRQRQQR